MKRIKIANTLTTLFILGVFFSSLLLPPASAGEPGLGYSARMSEHSSPWVISAQAKTGQVKIPSNTLQVSYSNFLKRDGFTGLIYTKGLGEEPGKFKMVSVSSDCIYSAFDGKNISQKVSADNWGGLAFEVDRSYISQKTLDALDEAGLDNFGALLSCFGEDAVASALKSSPEAFSNILEGINSMNRWQEGGFQALVDTLGEQSVAAAFASSPEAFSNILEGINSMEIRQEGSFQALVDTLGEQSVAAAFASSPEAFSNILEGINSMNRWQEGGFQALVDILGKESIVTAFESSPSNFSSALSTFNKMGIDSFSSAYGILTSVVGEDKAREAFGRSPEGFVSVLGEINTMGDTGFQALVKLLGKESIAAAFASLPYHFSSFLRSINEIGVDSFSSVYGILTAVVGKDKEKSVFLSSPGTLSDVLKQINTMETRQEGSFQALVDTLGKESVAAAFASSPGTLSDVLKQINTMETRQEGSFQALVDTLGKESVAAVFASSPKEFSNILDAIKTMGDAGFQALINTLGEQSVAAAFASSPDDFSSILQFVNKMGIDSFSSAYGILTSVVGEDKAREAFGRSPEGFVSVLGEINTMGDTGFQALVKLLGKESIAAAFAFSPYGFSSALSTFNKMGIDAVTSARGVLISIVGEDNAKPIFMFSSAAFFNILDAINTMGNAGFQALVDTLGKESVVAAFIIFPYDFSAVLQSVNETGVKSFTDGYLVLSSVAGNDLVAEAFKNDPSGFAENLNYIINSIGTDDFKLSMEPLVKEFGVDMVGGVLMDNGRAMHLERFWPQDLLEIIGNRLKNSVDNRPLAILIEATADWNEAFTLNESLFSSLIERGYRLMYYEASTEIEIVAALEDATRGEQASLIIFGGHGNQTTLQLSMTDDLGLEDIEYLLSSSIKNNLKDGGSIVLMSCSTGQGESSEINLARMMSAIYDNADHVFAPVTLSQGAWIIWDEASGNPAWVNFGNTDTFDAADFPLAYPEDTPGKDSEFLNIIPLVYPENTPGKIPEILRWTIISGFGLSRAGNDGSTPGVLVEDKGR